MKTTHSKQKIQQNMRVALFASWLIGCLILVSCGTSSQPQPASHTSVSTTALPISSSTPGSVMNMPIPTTGCGKVPPVTPGTSANQTIASYPAVSRGHTTRTYTVHIPAMYKPDHPEAVVLVFHGHGGSATDTDAASGFSELAEQRGFIAVSPQGLLDDDGLPFWASIGPIDYGIDDALFVSDLLTKLQTGFCVDPRRIYATGFSNGGGMSGFLACKMAGRIAAFAPISGNYYALPDGCHPGRAVPILEIHGTADAIVPYQGISARENPSWPLPSVAQWLQDWATRDGCTKGPVTFLQKSTVAGMQWTNCQKNATIVHYRVEGGGHDVPSSLGDRSTVATLWDFFQGHPL